LAEEAIYGKLPRLLQEDKELMRSLFDKE
jgi:hypothetical protein